LVGELNYSEETSPSAILSTTYPTRPDLRSIPGRNGRQPATNHLSYGTALVFLNFAYRFANKRHPRKWPICTAETYRVKFILIILTSYVMVNFDGFIALIYTSTQCNPMFYIKFKWKDTLD
jgi:hypothetical protein